MLTVLDNINNTLRRIPLVKQAQDVSTSFVNRHTIAFLIEQLQESELACEALERKALEELQAAEKWEAEYVKEKVLRVAVEEALHTAETEADEAQFALTKETERGRALETRRAVLDTELSIAMTRLEAALSDVALFAGQAAAAKEKAREEVARRETLEEEVSGQGEALDDTRAKIQEIITLLKSPVEFRYADNPEHSVVPGVRTDDLRIILGLATEDESIDV